MWYDVVVLVVLAFFTIRGAMKGVIWQIAGIAGIAICFLFADGISQFVGPLLAPHVQLQEPLNHWVILFVAYLVLSLISFAIARSATKWVEKAELKEFNQHLGGILGLAKGILLVTVFTFMIVTVSPDARTQLKDSKTGWACAHIMYHVHPILPPKLHDSVEQYIHVLDDPDLEQKYAEFGHSTDPNHVHGGDAPSFGSPPPVENQGGGSAAPWSGSNVSQPPTNTNSSLSAQLSELAFQKIGQTIAIAADPKDQSQIQTHVQQVLSQLTPQEKQQLESQITTATQQQMISLINNWLSTPAPPTAPAQPAAPPTRQGSGAVASPSDPFDFLNRGSNGATPASPASNSTTASSSQAMASKRHELAVKVAERATSLPAIRDSLAAQIETMLTSAQVPDGIAINILDDWYADLSGTPDPVPATNRATTPQQRILHHMQSQQAQSLQPGVR